MPRGVSNNCDLYQQWPTELALTDSLQHKTDTNQALRLN